MPAFPAAPARIDGYTRRNNPPAAALTPLCIPWKHFCWASDPAWTNPGNGNPVDSMRNMMGGGDPASTGTNRPTFRSSVAAYNNKPTVEFATALSQYLDFDVANMSQPLSIVVVGNTGLTLTAERLVGIGASTGNGVGDNTTNAWLVQAGAGLTGGTSDTNPHLLRGYLNGASSVIAVDGTTIATGNASTNTLTRLTLGAGSSSTPTFGNYATGNIACAGITSGDVSTLWGWASFKAWVRSFYGLTIA